jgi:hypothetical protein
MRDHTSHTHAAPRAAHALLPRTHAGVEAVGDTTREQWRAQAALCLARCQRSRAATRGRRERSVRSSNRRSFEGSAGRTPRQRRSHGQAAAAVQIGCRRSAAAAGPLVAGWW